MKTIHAIPLVLLLAVAAGCGKKENPPPAASEAPAIQPVAPPAAIPVPAGVTISSISLGNAIGADKRVTAPGTSFGNKDTIYVSVETQGTGNATLTAKWTYHKGDVTAPVKENTMDISTNGPAVHVFHISMPMGMPSGNYQVEVLADNKSAGVSKFTIN